MTGTDANDLVQVANLLNGKNGIYAIINNSHQQAGYSGHIDAIINGDCISSAYTTPSEEVKSIRIWILNKINKKPMLKSKIIIIVIPFIILFNSCKS